MPPHAANLQHPLLQPLPGRLLRREAGAEVAQEVGHLLVREAVAERRHGAEIGMGRHRDAIEHHMKKVVGQGGEDAGVQR